METGCFMLLLEEVKGIFVEVMRRKRRDGEMGGWEGRMGGLRRRCEGVVRYLNVRSRCPGMYILQKKDVLFRKQAGCTMKTGGGV